MLPVLLLSKLTRGVNGRPDCAVKTRSPASRAAEHRVEIAASGAAVEHEADAARRSPTAPTRRRGCGCPAACCRRHPWRETRRVVHRLRQRVGAAERQPPRVAAHGASPAGRDTSTSPATRRAGRRRSRGSAGARRSARSRRRLIDVALAHQVVAVRGDVARRERRRPEHALEAAVACCEYAVRKFGSSVFTAGAA